MSDYTREKIEKLEGEESELASLEHSWKTLLEHPGWELVKSVLEEKMALRAAGVMMSPLMANNNTHVQEFYKGEYAGVAFVLNLPAEQIDAIKKRLLTLRTELETEHDVEKQMATPTRSRVIDDDPFGTG